jgi:hypothetical protein
MIGLAFNADALVFRSIVLAIGFNYMLRLAESERKVLCDELLPLIQTFSDNSFQGSIKDFIADWINELNFKLGSGVALTEARRENMMADILAFMGCTAASIVVKPGTSKTLSVRIITDNLKGNRHSKILRRFDTRGRAGEQSRGSYGRGF